MVSIKRLVEDGDFLESLLTLLAGGTFAWVILEEIEALKDRAMEAAEELDDIDGPNAAMSMTNREVVRDLVLYFTFVSLVNEYLLSEAVWEHVIDDEVRTEQLHEQIQDMSPQFCLDVLFAAGVIDSGLKGDIGQVKGVRNNLVHELPERIAPSSEHDYTTQVDRGYRSVQRLVNLALDTGTDGD